MKVNRILNKPLFFSPLISRIIKDTELKLPDRAILSLLLELSNSKGYCSANNKDFAIALNCSLSTVSKSIKKLYQLGYIIKNKPDPDNGGRRYRRYLQQDLYYKSKSCCEKSCLVNNTKHSSKKKNEISLTIITMI